MRTARPNSYQRSLLASIFIKDQIKPKHLAPRFNLFLLYYASNYFAYTYNHYICSDFFRIFFLYVVLQNLLPPVAFEGRWTILTTTYI